MQTVAVERESTSRTFPIRVKVRVRWEQHAEMDKALGDGVGISSAMRDAALRAIGRDDLVIEVDTPEARRRKSAPPKARTSNAPREYAGALVNLTHHQHLALDTYARDNAIALSALLRDSLLTELGMPLGKPLDKWYPLGKRRSQPAPEKRKVAAKKKRRR